MATPRVVLLALYMACTCITSQSFASSTGGTGKNPKAGAELLLPGDIRPSHYNIHLTTHIEWFDLIIPIYQYEGVVVITMQAVQEGVKDIVLHAGSDIALTDDATFFQVVPGGEDIKFDMVDPRGVMSAGDKLTFTLQGDATMETGEDYVLTLAYKGVNRNDLRGFYRSSYIDNTGTTRWLLTTQFESTDARRAFPCFDEPQYKAKYIISISLRANLALDEGYSARSNTPFDHREGDSRFTTLVFKETPVPISSYLIAFVVSDYTGTDVKEFNSALPGENATMKEFMTWGRPSYISEGKGELSQEAGTAVMEIMTANLNVEFPYDKVDQFGIPDFAAGAMENWGLCTYREELLFFNPETGSEALKQYIVRVTAHELAHQWFGDLVTLWWWTDIWLNEGFATYYEYHASDKIRSDALNTSTWDLVGQMLVGETQSAAFISDAYPTARAMTDEVYDPEDIENNFDTFAYSRGGSFLRMVRHVMREDIFHDGLNRYLTKNNADVGTPESLWQSLQEAFDAATIKPNLWGYNTTELFQRWHQQPGYPVLRVQRTSAENSTKFTVNQRRFLLSGENDTTTWNVPFSFTYPDDSSWAEDTSPDLILPYNNFAILGIPEGSEWILLNRQATGYFRIDYDTDVWEALMKEINSPNSRIHPYNRAQIIDDSMNIARSLSPLGNVDYALALRILQTLKQERHLIPWMAGLNALSFLDAALATDDISHDTFKMFVQDLVGDAYTRLTMDVNTDADTGMVRLLRSDIVDWACKVQLPQCVEDAQNKFWAEFQPDIPETTTIRAHADVRSTVLCTVVREDDTSNAYHILRRLVGDSEVKNTATQLEYLKALMCTQDKDLLQQLLEDIFFPETVAIARPQDFNKLFETVHDRAADNVGVALTFIRDHLKSLSDVKFTSVKFIQNAVTKLADKVARANDMQTFRELTSAILNGKAGLGQAAMEAVDAARTRADINQQWLEVKQKSVKSWLRKA